MRVFNLAERLLTSGEQVLGPQESGALTIYLLYGVMAPGESGRRLRPGPGREEILFVCEGRIRLESGTSEAVCGRGMAVLIPEDADYWASNLYASTSSYVIAGGFTEPVHFLRQLQQQALQTQPAPEPLRE